MDFHPLRSAWAEINRTHLSYNIENIKRKVGSKTNIIGVIKADGYGHGALPVAKVLKKKGITTFAVATLEECIALRKGGIEEEIILLGLTPDDSAEILVDYRLTPVVSRWENAQAIHQTAKKKGITLSAYIAIDTGMGRIGYLPEDHNAVEEIRAITQLTHLSTKGIFSHFATADAKDKTFARVQESRLKEFYEKLRKAGIQVPMKTIANSAAIMDLPSTFFDQVRPGIILYGCYPSQEVNKKNIDLRPVMSIKAKILHLKEVPPGFSVGYGRKFIAKQPSKIATIGLGYADGYPRPYSEKGQVLLHGVFAPIAGNICMDQTMIDVTHVPEVALGDTVTVMGTDGKNTISADDIAQATGTINYEIVCAFGQRLPKVYVD